jgi:hypothetical protein
MTKNNSAASKSKGFDSTKEELLRILAQSVALRDGDFRMKQLLADFDKGNGFAKGWRMAVGECFRDSLDIKSIKQTDETTDEAANEVVSDESIMKWTQGGTFSFSQGDTIYDNPRAYQRWDKALKSICVAYQILQATPSRPRKEITYIKRNTSFTGSLTGGQIARRREVVKATPPDWVEEKNLIEIVEDATGKAPTAGLLQTLCDMGALDQRVDAEPRFPGVVRFRVLVPNADTSKLCIKEEKVLSQDDFVALLITGKEFESLLNN